MIHLSYYENEDFKTDFFKLLSLNVTAATISVKF